MLVTVCDHLGKTPCSRRVESDLENTVAQEESHVSTTDRISVTQRIITLDLHEQQIPQHDICEFDLYSNYFLLWYQMISN